MRRRRRRRRRKEDEEEEESPRGWRFSWFYQLLQAQILYKAHTHIYISQCKICGVYKASLNMVKNNYRTILIFHTI